MNAPGKGSKKSKKDDPMAFGDVYLKRKWKKKTLTVSKGNLSDALTTFLMSMKLIPDEDDVKTIDFEGLTGDTIEITYYYEKLQE